MSTLMKTQTVHWISVSVLLAALIVSGPGCAPDTSQGDSLAVGDTITGTPMSAAEEERRLSLMQTVRDIRLKVFWNGSAVSQMDGDISLKFFRMGESESFHEISWSTLAARASEHSCGRHPESDRSVVYLCDGSLGPLNLVTKVEGKRTPSGESKATTFISRTADKDKQGLVEIHFY